MKIGRYQFQAAKVQVGDILRGYMEIPQGAKIVHIGVEPALKGNLCAWVEESSIALTPNAKPIMETHHFMLLKEGHEVPSGHEFKAHIFANPVLLVYMQTAEAGGRNKLN